MFFSRKDTFRSWRSVFHFIESNIDFCKVECILNSSQKSKEKMFFFGKIHSIVFIFLAQSIHLTKFLLRWHKFWGSAQCELSRRTAEMMLSTVKESVKDFRPKVLKKKILAHREVIFNTHLLSHNFRGSRICSGASCEAAGNA